MALPSLCQTEDTTPPAVPQHNYILVTPAPLTAFGGKKQLLKPFIGFGSIIIKDKHGGGRPSRMLRKVHLLARRWIIISKGVNGVEVILNDIEVICVVAEAGPADAQKDFDKLESKLKSLKGRRFYGTYHAGEYRACVALLPSDKPDAMGLETYLIPGGKYIRRKMMQWTERLPEIGKTFIAMSEQYPTDPARPSIEFYKSQSELLLFLPLL